MAVGQSDGATESASEESRPLLTIAIPTWNRARFLELTLGQLVRELSTVPFGQVEILICDNCSTDGTADIIRAYASQTGSLRSVRNAENIGSDANIAQCFNRANGHYVLILGDDDTLIDGALPVLLRELQSRTSGVICIRPFGYDRDFREEHPGRNGGRRLVFCEASEFLSHIGPLMTLISANVINRDLLNDTDARAFCGSQLVQVHLVLRAALRAAENVFLADYFVACKRNNSGGYHFATVFVENFGKTLDDHLENGLTRKDIAKIENRFLLTYYPTYLMRERRSAAPAFDLTSRIFEDRFGGRVLFNLWVLPILKLPYPLAMGWGYFAIATGRIIGGDFRRGVFFLMNFVRQRLRRSGSTA